MIGGSFVAAPGGAPPGPLVPRPRGVETGAAPPPPPPSPAAAPGGSPVADRPRRGRLRCRRPPPRLLRELEDAADESSLECAAAAAAAAAEEASSEKQFEDSEHSEGPPLEDDDRRPKDRRLRIRWDVDDEEAEGELPPPSPPEPPSPSSSPVSSSSSSAETKPCRYCSDPSVTLMLRQLVTLLLPLHIAWDLGAGASRASREVILTSSCQHISCWHFGLGVLGGEMTVGTSTSTGPKVTDIDA